MSPKEKEEPPIESVKNKTMQLKLKDSLWKSKEKTIKFDNETNPPASKASTKAEEEDGNKYRQTSR